VKRLTESEARAERIEPLAYGPADAAFAIGVSRSQVYELLADGTIVGRKLGRRTLITREELIRYLDSLPAATVEATP